MEQHVKNTRGRPRGFDSDQALDTAMRLFWERGYEATSMQDVVDAMKINRASLYGVFGDKEELLLKALARYRELHGAPLVESLVVYLRDGGDARAAIAQMFVRLEERLQSAGQPRGCLMTTCAAALGTPAAARYVAETLSNWEGLIYQVLRRAQTEGGLAADADPRALARFFVGVIQGMSLIARVNPDSSAVRDISKVALQVWRQ